ncbi:MAG: YbaN family protein [Dokdonella sp.]|uniref:YbaN family protein n=1 Tax=Dokdonella sp. TaxID=2291710 RepID=UPI0025BB7476|nr:YbaN family protein [Dokdonella sp.]MBX3700139.1 YbaN family protein [Dokdonella sp.]MCW5578518.1 YbaN family protein [Dokdonella sp.]
MSDAAPAPRSRLRWAWWLLAWLALGLAVLGVILPGLPTVPFVLLSAFAAARGSQRLHARLLADPHMGPIIRNWQQHGTVARRTKWTALGTMCLSGVLLLVFTPLPGAIAGIVIMGITALWLWRRPEPAQHSDLQ